MKPNYITTIGGIADVYDGPHATPKKLEKGPYFLSISSLEKGRLDLNKSAFLSEADFKKWTKRVTPKEGDLLFSYETRLGEAALMPSGIRACLGRRMGLLRLNREKVTPEYVLYAYLSPAFQQTIKANTITGATVDRIALNELPSFPIRIPPIEEQKKVAKLLSEIDKKIELNNRINAELEAMAKTLYDYWFVQFDFPDDSPQGQGKPYKTSGGKMVYNPTLKRKIPEGWEDCLLGDHVTFKRGISYKSGDIQDEGVPFLNLNSFSLSGEFKQTGTKYYNGKFKPESKLDAGELVIAITDVTRNADIIGKAFVIPDVFDEKPLISCDVACVSSKIFGVAYLEQLFNSDSYHKYIKHFASGTLVLHLDLQGVKWFKTHLPPRNLLEKFNHHCDSLFKQRDIVLKENVYLESLRDWLLPMLMNGQVSVGEAS
ncbi:MAG: restriction endonuclease subunit S [Aestuariibacter sp.]|jgi:type I restriction enzyme S subunit|nr:restriction endonuclease subunit S [Aestuariibacter sp.]MCP4238128.1 restriction endonuclease subunit S [Aestuariibacter sp.]MCP4526862.1 restriction endonuclease subunit S [Aestuariibacter sp.]MCP4947432.1 restriction endonuclease subunit S [Aestuariibacter sp.]